jgi:SAM-dependent methyltransferase
MSTSVLEAEATEFDAVAHQYEAELQQGLQVSGESSAYFASMRVAWTQRRLHQSSLSLVGSKGIDFGCGTGNSIPYLRNIPGLETVVGLDLSMQSLRIARSLHPHPSIHFDTPQNYRSRQDAGLVFCNGVFHHIPPALRPQSLAKIWDFLEPGGVFAFWENNPWNPGTRYVMHRIPFDRDAKTLSIPQSRRMLERVGFEILCIDTCFYFPRAMKWFRGLEPCLCKFPLGAQYLILAQKRQGCSIPT